MKRWIAVLLLVAIAAGLCGSVFAAQRADAAAAEQTTAQYLLESIPEPGVDHGVEIFALAASGTAVPEGYFSRYYNALAARLQQSRGALGQTRYQDYAQAVLTLTAIGRDPRSVCGYDLTQPLLDYQSVADSGLRGVAYALLALDCGGYAQEETSAPTARELYVNYLLNRQLTDGGWAFSGSEGSARATAIVLQALSGYEANTGVRGALTLGVEYLASAQSADGGYGSAQADADVILALVQLGISINDGRFVKNTYSVMDALLRYHTPDTGLKRSAYADLPTAALALLAQHAATGGSSFRMEAPAEQTESADPGVRPSVQTAPGTTFQDIVRHPNCAAIEQLASYEIINGMGDGKFQPDETMTRAQFAKIVVCSLGLTPEYRGTFSDVPEKAWYAGYVDTAAAYGIVNGVGNGQFDPDGLINRQAAAAMVARAARLCGLDTAVDEDTIQKTLSAYPDGGDVSAYARQPMAFCCHTAILTGDRLEPLRPILRCEIAQMLYNMLLQTPLLQ